MPTGWYRWSSHPYGVRWPVTVDRTPEGALAAARKLDPAAPVENLKQSDGDLLLSFLLPDGSLLDCARYGPNFDRARRR
jgi:hypothetical protein